jgi:hypothetical protein
MDQALEIREGESRPVPLQLARFDLSPRAAPAAPAKATVEKAGGS